MRAIVDLVDSIGSSIRFIFLLIFLTILGFGLMFTAGASYVAPQVADKVVERAERFGERAIEEERLRRLGTEGWGHTTSGRVASTRTEGQFGEDEGGWAEEPPSGY
ncbi:hypothetical protein [Erythrobacter sp. JK5]|uniref:hypothetical protein n=1 Tax=Erythrobacter sp. JK5 TaxID=2829500 RepID=UPI001BA91AC7|nr:hypothetical protein [Erythrobacter sp. JK5]QUL38092.1 hypothetical protein KDC96_01315 [Erythrobacter sp. JK5]